VIQLSIRFVALGKRQLKFVTIMIPQKQVFTVLTPTEVRNGYSVRIRSLTLAWSAVSAIALIIFVISVFARKLIRSVASKGFNLP
jgi:hypothetical protein